MRRAATSTATARISTPSSGGCGRAISASMPCISTCTRPSRRRMAAAGRAPGRWCSRRRSSPSRRCRASSRKTGCSGWRRRTSAAFGRMKAFHGQMGMFVRALAYMMSHGADGLRQVSGDAVLNANYLLRQLEGAFSAPFAHARAGDARGAVRRPRAQGYRRLDAGHRQGDDRRGAAPDDGLFSAGGAWRDAGRADRDRDPRKPRPLHRHHAGLGRARKGRRAANGGPLPRPPPPPRRNPRRPQGRCSAGNRRGRGRSVSFEAPPGARSTPAPPTCRSRPGRPCGHYGQQGGRHRPHPGYGEYFSDQLPRPGGGGLRDCVAGREVASGFSLRR